MMTSRVWVLAFGIWVLGFAVTSAQTLGDIAKREETRRKQVKTPSKVYTNEDLRGDGGAPPPAPVTEASSPNAPQPQGPAAGAQPKDADKAAAEDPKKTEAYWKDRLAKARGDLDRAKTFADALQSRVNALTTDFSLLTSYFPLPTYFSLLTSYFSLQAVSSRQPSGNYH